MLWKHRVPAGPASGAGQAAGVAEHATGGTPSHGHLGWGVALRGRSCLPGEDISTGIVLSFPGLDRTSLPASAVAAFLVFSLMLQKGQCFLLKCLLLNCVGFCETIKCG